MKQKTNPQSSSRFQILAPRFCRASRGFTLIEVLIVMGITSILLVMGAMSMLSYVGSQNLESETRSIIALLRDAQTRSAGQDNESRWGVYFRNNTGDRDSYYIFQADEVLVSSSTYTDVPGTTLEQRTMRSNVEFVTPETASSTSVIFAKVSGLPNASTSIVLQKTGDSSNQRTVLIGGNGKIDYQ